MKILNRYHYYTFSSYLLAISVIIITSAIVVGISWLIRDNEFFYIPNTLTFGIFIPDYILLGVLVLVTSIIFYFDVYKHYMIPVVLFLSGGWSNGIEKLLFDSVTDYIPFINSYINIADIMIWVGLIWLNIMIWFFPSKSDLLESKLSNPENRTKK